MLDQNQLESSLLFPALFQDAHSPFTPKSIPGLQLWLRADKGTFQDSAKTTAATSDADVIGAWADFSGNGRDVLQATTTKKPTLRLNVQNGRPVIRFDGTDDFLRASYSNIVQPYVRFVVVKSGGAHSRHIINSASSNNAALFTHLVTEIHFTSFAGTLLVGSVIDLNWHILSAIFNEASSSIRTDGAATLGNAGDNVMVGGTTIGASNVGSFTLDGDIAEVLDYTGINSDEVGQIEQYLAGRYGITLA